MNANDTDATFAAYDDGDEETTTAGTGDGIAAEMIGAAVNDNPDNPLKQRSNARNCAGDVLEPRGTSQDASPCPRRTVGSIKNNTQDTNTGSQKDPYGEAANRRTLVYLDIENLLGPHRLCTTGCWTPHLHRSVLPAVRLGCAGHLVVAAGRAAALPAGLTLPAARLLVGRGVDGADKKILEDVDVEWIRNHYTDVVFGSGDHIVAPAARELRRAGLVVAVRHHASSLLLAEADWIRLVQYPSHCDPQKRALRAGPRRRRPNLCGITPGYAGMVA